MPLRREHPGSFILAAAMLAGGASASAQIATSGNLSAVGHHCVIKVLQTDPLPATGMVPVVVKGAKGEFVDFQVFIAPFNAGTSLAGVNITLSDFSGPGGAVLPKSNANLYSEFYHNITQASPTAGKAGWVPDALIPIGPDTYYGEPRGPMGTVNSFTVAAGQNQGFWVDLFIPPGTAPGAYNGTITITDSASDTVSLPVQLTVWNFSIPATPSIPSLLGGVGRGGGGFDAGFGNGMNFPLSVTLEQVFMEDAIRNRASIGGIPEKLWTWSGTSITWRDTGSYPVLPAGFDATDGAFLSGNYSALGLPGANDPYLKTGPKLQGFYAFSMSGGSNQGTCGEIPTKTSFNAPRLVTVSTDISGNLPGGTWYYMIASSVTGQGDSGPQYCFGTSEFSATLGGQGSVTLSWQIPQNAYRQMPDAFAIYRSPNPSMGSSASLGHGETLFAVIPVPPPGTATAGFTDDGTIPAVPNAPVPHLYNATARNEAIQIIQAVGAHFQANGWSPPFAYMFDEPHDRFQYDSVAYWSGVFRQAGLGVRPVATTELPDPWGSAAFPQYHRNLVGQLDTWVPNAQTISYHYWPAAYRSEQTLGRHVWFYDSNNANGKPRLQPSSILDFPALSNRIKGWWAARENFEGYLYFATVYGWSSSCQDIWTVPNPNRNTTYVPGTSPPQVCIRGFGDNGDGLLFYPGRACSGPNALAPSAYCIGGTHPIPVDSMRLKMLRDGEQDLEYLLLLYNPRTQSGNLALFNQILAAVFPSPTLPLPGPGLSASAQTIPLSTVAGVNIPSGYPDSYLNIEGSEIVAYGGGTASNNTLTKCNYADPANNNNYSCRGYFNSGASVNNNSVGVSHPAGAAVLSPPSNVMGSYLGDPMPLLNARDQVGCALDPANCPQTSSTTPSPLTGLKIQ